MRTTGFRLKCLILIEFPNTPYWKPAKKNQIGCGLGQNLCQIMSNVAKKVKKQATSLGFFHILLGDYLSKQETVVVKLPEWKFVAIITRNAKCEGC